MFLFELKKECFQSWWILGVNMSNPPCSKAEKSEFSHKAAVEGNLDSKGCAHSWRNVRFRQPDALISIPGISFDQVTLGLKMYVKLFPHFFPTSG